MDRDSVLGNYGQFDASWRGRMSFEEAIRRTADHLALRIEKNPHSPKNADERRELARLREYGRPAAAMQQFKEGNPRYKHISAKERRKRSKPGKGKHADKGD